MDSQTININKGFKQVWFFFPLQLVFVVLKKNLVILFFWVILFAYITENLGVKYGFHHLFLYPEYLGEENFLSHLLLGFCCGIFIMIYNISSYMLNGFRFPFLATLNKPFLKWCLNNFIIPGLFFIFFVVQLVRFQYFRSDMELSAVLENIGGFVFGNILFIAFVSFYFYFTSKGMYSLFGVNPDEVDKKHKNETPMSDAFHKKVKWYKIFNMRREWRTAKYLSSPFKVSIARESVHYDKRMLESVFSRNTANASYFEFLLIILLLILGFFREIPVLEIPAGASIFLLLALFLMVFSAIHSWMRGWSTLVFVGLFLILNAIISPENDYYESQVYGLNYSTPKVKIDNTIIAQLTSDSMQAVEDMNYHLEILNNWRKKNIANSLSRSKKPKLVIINSSGGGLRSALWTFQTVSYVDSILNGELLNHTHLITGASGGMIGAAYFRELYLQKRNKQITNSIIDYRENVAKDLLNAVSKNMVTSDMFFRFQEFEYNGNKYKKDRGYVFEKRLTENIGVGFNRTLNDYLLPEKNGDIPLMIFSPTIINDGRRMLISSHPTSFLCTTSNTFRELGLNKIPESFDYYRLFKDRGAGETKFSSVIRMSSTFPYIMPAVTLPTNPSLHIMDAGMRDNYGLITGLSYISTFRNWINTNTSGVIIVQTRDKPKNYEFSDSYKDGFINEIVSPLGSFYNNWPKIQTFEQDMMIEYASSIFEVPLDVISFELQTDAQNPISLSWHLTEKEKQLVYSSTYSEYNKRQTEKLKKLLQ